MAASWCCHYRLRLLLRLWTFLRTDAIPSITITTTVDSYNLDSHNKTSESTSTTWRETWKSRMERGHLDINASATVNACQWFRYSDTIPLYSSTSKLSCFWAIFSSPAIIQTNSSVAWEVVQKIRTWMNHNHETTLPLIHYIAYF